MNSLDVEVDGIFAVLLADRRGSAAAERLDLFGIGILLDNSTWEHLSPNYS